MKYLFIILTFLGCIKANGQTRILPTTPLKAVYNLIDTTNNILEYDSVRFVGKPEMIGILQEGFQSGLDINEGVVLSTGRAELLLGPNLNDIVGKAQNIPGDSLVEQELGLVPPFKSYDAVQLRFKVRSKVPQVVFTFQFFSEEYVEYVDEVFNDVFAVFVEGTGYSPGTNIARVTSDNITVTINNINHKTKSEYYIDNPVVNEGPIQADGYTVELGVILNLVPCEWYDIKFILADISDPVLDSWVVLRKSSFKSRQVQQQDTVLICAEQFPMFLEAPVGYKYDWSTGDTTKKITITKPGLYRVSTYDCNQVNIYFYEVTKPVVSSLPEDILVCEQRIINLEAQTNASHYAWQNSRTKKIDSTLNILVNQSDLYTFTSFNDKRCLTTDTVNVEIYEEPYAKLEDNYKYYVCDSEKTTLSIFREIDGYSYRWNTGETTSTINIFTPGKYTLVVSNQGCTPRYFTVEVIQSTLEELLRFIPNAISPNRDGINDVFRPFKEAPQYNINEASLQVYDRWGALIHDSKTDGLEWTPIQNMNGVYLYMIKYKNPCNRYQYLSGTIHVVK